VIAVYCTTKHAITTDTMDFPMLDETMERHGQVLDHETSEEGGQRAEEQRVNEQRVNEQRERYEVHHQEIQDDPSRWWLASSAFPMIAGTMGPVASAFSICALVRPWRQHLPPGTDIQDGIFVADPVWLTVVNAIQLVVAVVSNVFLLLNMARRVRFAIAQPITIVGWYISAICLVCLVAAGARELLDSLDAPKDEYVWSQAFWYGVWAALLYFIVATLMAVTVYGAHEGHYPQNFNLTNSQRTLMLQTMMVLAYLLIGAVVFSKLEGWSYLDGVYWSCVTILTVGFGEFTLTNLVARWLLLPYALVGIISLGLVIGSIRSLVIDRGRRKIEARVIEMARRRYLRKMAKAGKDDILAPIREDGQDPSCSGGTSREFLRRRAEFELMRKIQADAARRRRWVALGSSAGTWAVLWLIGAKVFQEAEKPYQNWRFGNGVYFTYVTLTTIGYGDTVPISNCGKSFFVFWALLALPTTTVLISNAGDTVVKFVCDVTIQGGKVTILPGENSFAQETRNLVNRLSCGRLFKNLNSTQPSSSAPPLGPELSHPAAMYSSSESP
jgi:potassium channel subfamily K